ncbi:hypothetical protein Btru_024148 [Bulinus truncatus]|nr:hypothetical protein Btru_024148 [Bulinus truncatus]
MSQMRRLGGDKVVGLTSTTRVTGSNLSCRRQVVNKMEVAASKGLCIVLLFLDTLLFGLPPYLLVRKDVHPSERATRIRSAIVSYLTCFSGGVFFGACFLHLLAEGREEMETYFKQVNVTVEFPVYETVVAAGFFSITLIEQIAHRFLSHSHTNALSHSHTNVTTPADISPGERPINSKEVTPTNKTGLDNPLYKNDTSSTLEISTLSLAVSNGVTSQSTTDRANHPTAQTTSKAPPAKQEEEGLRICCKVSQTNGTAVGYGATSEGVITFHNHAESEKEEGHCHSKDAELVRIAEIIEVNPLRAFLMLAALSFHTVFDGLAVGLQEESEDVWEMFIAICIHKSLVALCLGVQLFIVYRSKPVKAFIWVFVFSIISPLGVGLGIILTSGHMDKLAENLVSWILQAVATGTFMYVTFFEILWEELVNKKGVLRLLLVVIGFGCMAIAKYFDKD